MRLSQWQPVREVTYDQPLPRPLRLRQRSPRPPGHPRTNSQPPLACTVPGLQPGRNSGGDRHPHQQRLGGHPECPRTLRGRTLLRLLHILITHSKPMKNPYNSKSRIVLDICIQVIFYLVLIAGFWTISFLIP